MGIALCMFDWLGDKGLSYCQWRSCLFDPGCNYSLHRALLCGLLSLALTPIKITSTLPSHLPRRDRQLNPVFRSVYYATTFSIVSKHWVLPLLINLLIRISPGLLITLLRRMHHRGNESISQTSRQLRTAMLLTVFSIWSRRPWSWRFSKVRLLGVVSRR